MKKHAVVILVVASFALSAPDISAQAQVAGPGGTQFEIELLRPAGGPVVPFFEGWFQNPDGTYELVFGYFNVNTEEVLDIPLGPANRIEPQQFDGVQPTHFLPVPEGDRRHWGVFSVTVPADFGDQDVVWTLQTRGQELSVPGRITRPPYELDGWDQPGRLTVAPWLQLDEDSPVVMGPAGHVVGPYETVVGRPLSLNIAVGRDNHHREEDDRPVRLRWAKHQGPGTASFDEIESQVPPSGGSHNMQVTFSEPGEYMLRLLAYNAVNDFEFFCCWTNGFIKVTVGP